MAFLTTSPISMMKPIAEKMLRVEPPTISPISTPDSAKGSAIMMARGCKKLPNCEASTR